MQGQRIRFSIHAFPAFPGLGTRGTWSRCWLIDSTTSKQSCHQTPFPELAFHSLSTSHQVKLSSWVRPVSKCEMLGDNSLFSVSALSDTDFGAPNFRFQPFELVRLSGFFSRFALGRSGRGHVSLLGCVQNTKQFSNVSTLSCVFGTL